MRVTKIKKRTTCLIFLLMLVFLLFTQQLSAKTGFGPAEIFCNNKTSTRILGTASLINGDTESKHGIFTLFNPYVNLETWHVVPTELTHARAVCLDCEHGMQRHEAIPGYIYGDPLIGRCITTRSGTGCGSDNLRFYKLFPRDEYQYLWLETAGNFHLEKVPNPFLLTWVTEEKIAPGGACNVYIMYDPSDSFLLENFDAHWEFHLRGTTSTEKTVTGNMVPGIDLRILFSFKFPLYLEVITPIIKGEPFIVKVTYGDNTGSWGLLPPEGTQVTFDGETQTVGSNGTATFVFPDERGDYEYELTASSDDAYEPVTKTISENIDDPVDNPNDNTDEPFISLSNPWFILIIICAVVVIVIVVCVKYYYYY